jgi:hypothetical protein
MMSGGAKFGGGAAADPRQGTLSFDSQRAPSLRVAAQQQQLHAVHAADQGLQAKSGAELAVEAAQTAKDDRSHVFSSIVAWQNPKIKFSDTSAQGKNIPAATQTAGTDCSRV